MGGGSSDTLQSFGARPLQRSGPEAGQSSRARPLQRFGPEAEQSTGARPVQGIGPAPRPTAGPMAPAHHQFFMSSS